MSTITSVPNCYGSRRSVKQKRSWLRPRPQEPYWRSQSLNCCQLLLNMCFNVVTSLRIAAKEPTCHVDTIRPLINYTKDKDMIFLLDQEYLRIS